MIPLGEEFGWDRAEISFGLSVAALTLAIATPLVGRLLDRFGPRRVLLSSLILYSSATMLLYFLNAALVIFYLALALISLVGAGSNTVAYARVLSGWFDLRRGLAMGLTMAGIGVGSAIATVVAQSLMDVFGWRGAYLGLGLMVMLVAFPIQFFVIRNSPGEMGLLPDGIATNTDRQSDSDMLAPSLEAVGLTRAEAFRSREFWLLLSIFFVLAVAINGVHIHFIPLLRDHGISAQWAAAAAGFSGLATVVGRVGVGYFSDRFFAPRVGISVYLCAMAGVVLLQITDTVWLAFVCAVLLGIGGGAGSNLLGYLSSRYFGLLSFGELSGYMFSAFMIGTAVGPYAVGLAYELGGSYQSALWWSFVGVGFTCVLLASLGPFPNWTVKPIEP